MHEQMVFGEKPGEQHAVPILIGEFSREVLQRLLARFWVQGIAQLATSSA
jgi:hypothetical protein